MPSEAVQQIDNEGLTLTRAKTTPVLIRSLVELEPQIRRARMAAKTSKNYDAVQTLNLAHSWIYEVLDERYPEAFDAAGVVFDATPVEELAKLDWDKLVLEHIPDSEKYETVTTYHGQSFPVIPGRTVVISRNGFTDDVKNNFESSHDRDRWVTHQKRTFACKMRATHYQYSAL